MKLLVRHIVRDADLKLSDVQVHKVNQEVQRELASRPSGRLIQMLPMFILLAVPVFSWMRTNYSFGIRLLYELVFTLTFLCVLLLIWRHMYKRFTYKAIVTLGFADICTRCGYDLHALPINTDRCPECGQPK